MDSLTSKNTLNKNNAFSFIKINDDTRDNAFSFAPQQHHLYEIVYITKQSLSYKIDF